MNLLENVWRCTIGFLVFSITGSPLLPADCEVFIPLGHLSVDPAPPFLLGSNLTVHCHLNDCNSSSKMLLELNKKTANPSERLNCTTAKFLLTDVRTPRSSVVCKKEETHMSIVVDGMDLRAGLPPDKPANISCKTTKSSDSINCSWTRGRESYLDTVYNISLQSENGTQIYLTRVRDGEKLSIPRAVTHANTKYTLSVGASNQLGANQAEPFFFEVAEIVIPETPHVAKVEFDNSTISARLHWSTLEPSMDLRAQVRLQTDHNPWELRNGTQLREGLIRVEDLEPLTEYEFQVRTCAPAAGPLDNRGSLCSQWSQSAKMKSPGKAPSQQLNTWRTFGDLSSDGLRRVNVWWKALPPESYSGDLLNYTIDLGDGREHVCASASYKCLVLVPAAVQVLRVSAATSYGTSPPAEVDLRQTGAAGLVLQKLLPADDGMSVHVSWSAAFGGELLFFTIQWESLPAAEVQWKKVTKDARSTTITGLNAGVRYNVSVFAATSGGVSAPASGLIYSREQRPVSAPVLRVLDHQVGWIHVRWDQLPVRDQRGFITAYNLYMWPQEPSGNEISVTVPGSGPHQMWLDCPDGALALQLSASTSAGEGPRGGRVSSHPSVGLVIVLMFSLTFFIVIVANLMCWKCVRRWMKQKCISWGPEWLVEKLPKPGRSTAIRLLKDDRSEPLFSSSYIDPPLSPILVISQEEIDNVYPTIDVQFSQDASGQAALDAEPAVVEHSIYKPQIVKLVPQEEELKEVEEEKTEASESSTGDRSLFVCEGLLRGLLSSVDTDPSNLSGGVMLNSVGGLLWAKTDELTVLDTLSSQDGRPFEEEFSLPCLDLEQHQRHSSDQEAELHSPETQTPIGGYFPQFARLGTATLQPLR